jgi:predicted RecB family nuclease
MRLQAQKLLFSASDLVNFLGCAHASYLDLRQLVEPVEFPHPDAAAALIQQKGLEHERSYLAALIAGGRNVIEISGDDIAERTALTREAMRCGIEVIYQGALVSKPWLGYADFLERVDQASDLGTWGYEAVDTKLARSPKPEYVVQLATYSRLLGAEQGRMPAQMHVLLGNGQRVSLRVADFAHYHVVAQERLQQFGAAPPASSIAEPCGHCGVCRWFSECETHWEIIDHLSLIANISRSQRGRLCEADISTVRSLATSPSGWKVPRIQAETLDRLQHQAALQIAKRDTGQNQLELLPLAEGKGLARLPRPNPGDVFFDMEGYPFFEDGSSLEYLFGFVTKDSAKLEFTTFWGHDRQAEKRAFEAAIDFTMARLKEYPSAFIYHYANYEESALKRLAMIHGTRELEVDDLLRRRKLVDLYKVVREGIRVSEPRYSLKNIEVFYTDGRAGDVTTASDSIVAYDRYLQTGDNALLDQIGTYNEADCRSLLLCRDWLLGLRPAETPWFEGQSTTAADAARDAKRREAEARNAALVRALVEGAPPGEAAWRELAGQLVDFHRREAKPDWWATFNRQEMSEEELIDDPDCIGALEPHPDRQSFAEKLSIIYTYRFPAQDFKIRLGDHPVVSGTRASTGEVVRLDGDALEISIKRAKNREPLPARFSLIPSGPLGDDVLRAAIARYVSAVLKGNENQYSALTGILRREFPRFVGFAGIGADPSEVARAVDAIGRLDGSHLLVQGPPGAGKTYTASHAIVEMLSLGKRVGVASHSHKAINNLLVEVEKVAAARKLTFRGIKKSSYEEQFLKGSVIEDTTDNETATMSGHDLIAGTAWLFARDDLDQQLDYLFVDEAGQVSLSNTIAMGVSARNVILIGDQMQLSQPLKGSHPGRSGWSALEHLLDGAATVPPGRGVFLSTSRRMHPDICEFVSDAFYDGRLMPEPGNERQCLVLDQRADPMLSSTGLRFVAVEHDGCSQRSEPEADRVRELYESLLGQRWTDREGVVCQIGMDDILVVSPYNMQVNLLRSRLPPGAHVGTVDRFQGQQAAAVLISMATSSGDDLPRQIEFLFSRNRLNVAVSRARCYAGIIASPKLLATSCSTIEQMRLVNTLCWARNIGGPPHTA